MSKAAKLLKGPTVRTPALILLYYASTFGCRSSAMAELAQHNEEVRQQINNENLRASQNKKDEYEDHKTNPEDNI